MPIRQGYYVWSDDSFNIDNVNDPEFIKAYEKWAAKPPGRGKGLIKYKGKTFGSLGMFRDKAGTSDSPKDIREVVHSDNDGLFNLGELAPLVGLGLMFIPGMQAAALSLGASIAPAAAFATQAAIGTSVLGGIVAETQGGDFLKGAALSGVGSVAGGYIQPGLSESLGGGSFGNIAADALIGGGVSELSGGDFAQGALISGIGSGINQAKLSAASYYLDSLPGGQGVYTDAPPDMSDFDLPPAVIDTSFTPDYSLFSGAPTVPDMGAQGIQVPTINELVDVVNQPVDYFFPVPDAGFGMQIPQFSNLDELGGGQGISIPVVDLPPYVAPDTSFVPDYSLSVGEPVILDMGAQGIQVPTIDELVDVVNQPVDYALPIPDAGLGLQMPTAPNLDAMGGGQGITVPVDGGTLTEAGVIPDMFVPDLGDPNSFINQPAPDVSVNIPELAEKTPVDIDTKLSLLNAAQGVAPAIVNSLLADKAINQPEQRTGFDIVPIPGDWRSPEYNMAFTPSEAIDFGNVGMLAGTQFANQPQAAAPSFYNLSDLINMLNYQSVPFVQQQYQMPEQSFSVPDILQQFQTNPNVGMNDIIGNLDRSPVTLNSIIAGIQSQYG